MKKHIIRSHTLEDGTTIVVLNDGTVGTTQLDACGNSCVSDYWGNIPTVSLVNTLGRMISIMDEKLNSCQIK